jgi:hypothetical protein
MSIFKFSGHETFHCKSFWIKKGFDFIDLKNDFKDQEAVVELGVGKNMVSSVNFWMHAFEIQKNDTLSDWAKLVFENNGLDPFLENIGTNWLLHFHLLQNDYASINKIAFNQFRKTRLGNEFTSSQFNDFLLRFCTRNNISVSSKTIDNDVKVFLKNYAKSLKVNFKSLEEDSTTLLTDISLIKEVEGMFQENEQVYRFNYSHCETLPSHIFFYAIKSIFPNYSSISILDIQQEVSELFLCNREGTEEKLNALQEIGLITKKEDAGRYEIQIKSEITRLDILKQFYA